MGRHLNTFWSLKGNNYYSFDNAAMNAVRSRLSAAAFVLCLFAANAKADSTPGGPHENVADSGRVAIHSPAKSVRWSAVLPIAAVVLVVAASPWVRRGLTH